MGAIQLKLHAFPALTIDTTTDDIQVPDGIIIIIIIIIIIRNRQAIKGYGGYTTEAPCIPSTGN